MTTKPPEIRCSKCNIPAQPELVKCLKCGARIIKICGACGFQNSVAKNFCDSCGEPQGKPLPMEELLKAAKEKEAQLPARPPKAAAPPPKAADAPAKAADSPPKAAAPAAPAAHEPRPTISADALELPRTRIMGLPPTGTDSPPPAPPKGAKAPAPAPPHAKEGQAVDLVAPPTHATITQVISSRLTAYSILSTLVSLFLLALGGLLYVVRWQHRQSPKTVLMQTAQRYVSALHDHNYEAAYPLLSSESRRNCTLEEFKATQDDSDWSFEGLEVSDFNKDRALVIYTLRSASKEPVRDWLRFVYEDGRWARAYWWNLSRKLEETLSLRDYAGAGTLAQAAVEVDPLDPMARSYLCEALYGAGNTAAAERECLQTVELAKVYPSILGDRGLYRVHSILGDLYKNGLRKYPEAIQHFDILLALPGLDKSRQCALTLARAESDFYDRDYNQALSDLRGAEKLCATQDDLDFIRREQRALDGKAGDDAVAMLKKQDLPQTRGAPEGNWIPEHLGGSLYKVSLLQGAREILAARVDLWSHVVKVESHVQ